MKKTLLATVIAATFLAGCSSNSSERDLANPIEHIPVNPDLDVTPSNPDAGIDVDMPTVDQPAVIEFTGGVVTVDGEVIGFINRIDQLVDTDGEVIGQVTREEDGFKLEFSDGDYLMLEPNGNGGWRVDSVDSNVDGNIGVGAPEDTKGDILVDETNGNVLIRLDDGAVVVIDAEGNYQTINGDYGHISDHGVVTKVSENGYQIEGYNGNTFIVSNIEGRLSVVQTEASPTIPQVNRQTVRSLSKEQRNSIKARIQARMN